MMEAEEYRTERNPTGSIYPLKRACWQTIAEMFSLSPYDLFFCLSLLCSVVRRAS